MSCACGCGGEPRERSRYAADACRARVYRRKHPLLEDFIDVKVPDDPLGRHALMETLREALHRGLAEDASLPKKRKSRQATKPRRHACDISPEHAKMLDELAADWFLSKRDYIEMILEKEWGEYELLRHALLEYHDQLNWEACNEAANPF